MSAPVPNSSITRALLAVVSAGGLAAVFCEPLGITKFVSENLMFAVLAVLGVFIVLSRWLDVRRARSTPTKADGRDQIPHRMMWVVIGLIAIISLSGPFWLPFTGGAATQMSFAFRALCSAFAFITMTGFIIFMFHRTSR